MVPQYRNKLVGVKGSEIGKLQLDRKQKNTGLKTSRQLLD